MLNKLLLLTLLSSSVVFAQQYDNTFTITRSPTSSATGVLYFEDTSSTANTLGFRAPATVTTTIWTLPSADNAGCLTSNGAGILTFGTCAGTVSLDRATDPTTKVLQWTIGGLTSPGGYWQMGTTENPSNSAQSIFNLAVGPSPNTAWYADETGMFYLPSGLTVASNATFSDPVTVTGTLGVSGLATFTNSGTTNFTGFVHSNAAVSAPTVTGATAVNAGYYGLVSSWGIVIDSSANATLLSAMVGNNSTPGVITMNRSTDPTASAIQWNVNNHFAVKGYWELGPQVDPGNSSNSIFSLYYGTAPTLYFSINEAGLTTLGGGLVVPGTTQFTCSTAGCVTMDTNIYTKGFTTTGSLGYQITQSLYQYNVIDTSGKGYFNSVYVGGSLPGSGGNESTVLVIDSSENATFNTVKVSGTSPSIVFDQTNAGADTKLWIADVSGTSGATTSTLNYYTANDANSSAFVYESLARSGNSITSISFPSAATFLIGATSLTAPSGTQLLVDSGILAKSLISIDRPGATNAASLDFTVSGSTSGSHVWTFGTTVDPANSSDSILGIGNNSGSFSQLIWYWDETGELHGSTNLLTSGLITSTNSGTSSVAGAFTAHGFNSIATAAYQVTPFSTYTVIDNSGVGYFSALKVGGSTSGSYQSGTTVIDSSQNATFASITDSGITGSTQCVQVNSSGLFSGYGGACGGSGGANTNLSNLGGTTSINSSLLPGSTGTLYLGQSSEVWAGLYVNSIIAYGTSTFSGGVSFTSAGTTFVSASASSYFSAPAITGTSSVTSSQFVGLSGITNYNGVSCSGTPTSSFASVAGIITHC